MKYVDEFRDPRLADGVIQQICQLLAQMPDRDGRPLQIMEVCGGHTHTIFRYALDQLLPGQIEFVHGPGCPVCVLPMSRLDEFISLGRDPERILCTFGDAMRVPGSKGSLQDARARGADVRIVYSPLDALKLAQANPDREVVFFALGFETTAPSTAMTLRQARLLGVANFSVFCQHISIIPTLQALLAQPDFSIDGFLLPGHVSMVIGSEPYDFIASEYGLPCVITGFEPLDLLQALYQLLCQIQEGTSRVENQYQRIVGAAGNRVAQEAMATVFQPRGRSEWRGLGVIPDSGLALAPEYGAFDAEERFSVERSQVAEPQQNRCGEVLTGRCRPVDCPLFGKACRPDTALGALMVSSEGACAAVYQYRREES